MDYADYVGGQPMTHCWLRGKKDLIKILLSRLTKSKKGKLRILNIGAGSGYDLEVLNKYGEVYVIDISKDVLKLVPKELCIEKKAADACNIPYRNNFFDIVVSFDVFEHIYDDKKAVSESNRVLKKDGYLVFSVPAYPFLFSSHDRALDHKRRYSKKILRKLLEKFHGLELNYWNSVLFPQIALLRILKKKSSKADHIKFPKIIHSFFYSIFKIENSLIKNGVQLPFGLSIIGYCRK